MNEIRYYRRDGTPYGDMLEWARDFDDFYKRRVAATTLPNGVYISTVWLGLDHQYGDGPPLIFETMAFSSDNPSDERDCERYATEAEAIAGHALMCAKWSKKDMTSHPKREEAGE